MKASTATRPGKTAAASHRRGVSQNSLEHIFWSTHKTTLTAVCFTAKNTENAEILDEISGLTGLFADMVFSLKSFCLVTFFQRFQLEHKAIRTSEQRRTNYSELVEPSKPILQ